MGGEATAERKVGLRVRWSARRMRNWISPSIEWRLFRIRSACTHRHTHANTHTHTHSIATNIWLTWVFYLMSFMETFRFYQKQHHHRQQQRRNNVDVEYVCRQWLLPTRMRPKSLLRFPLNFPSTFVIPLFFAFFSLFASTLSMRHSFSVLMDVYSVLRLGVRMHRCGYISLNWTHWMLCRAHFISNTHI